MKSLINRKETKKFILEKRKALRPGWDCNRVSAEALNEIDIYLKRKVSEMVHKHPTVGKTFKQVF